MRVKPPRGRKSAYCRWVRTVGDFGAVPTLLGGVLIGVEGCFFACLEFSDFFFPKFVLDDCLFLF